MAKRFTDTSKWKKEFFRGLDGPLKLLWLFILDECDMAGIWDVDFDMVELRIKTKFDPKKVLEIFGERIQPFDNGRKWFIKDFIMFQYGELKSTNRMHTAVINTLKKNHLDFTDGASKALPRAQGQGQGIIQGQGQGKGGVGEIFPSSILKADELCLEQLEIVAGRTGVNISKCFDDWDGWYCSKFTRWHKDFEGGDLTFAALRKSFESWLTDPKSKTPRTNGIDQNKMEEFKRI